MLIIGLAAWARGHEHDLGVGGLTKAAALV